MVPVQLVRMNISQSITYGKDLIWLNFRDEPREQERQQVTEQRSCISVT